MGFDFAWMTNPEGAFELVAAFILMAVAIAVFAIKPGRPAHQAFALLFFWRGVTMVGATGSLLGGDAFTREFSTLITFYSFMLFGVGAYWFVSVYPEPRGPFGRRGGLWLIVPAAAVMAVTAFMPDLIAANRGSFEMYVKTIQPVGLVIRAFVYAGFSLAAVLFALDYARSPSGRRCRSLFFVMLAFATHQAFDGAMAFTGGFSSLGLMVSSSIAAVGFIGACLVLLYGFERRSDPHRRRDFLVFLVLSGLSIGGGVFVASYGGVTANLTVVGLSRLVTAGLVAYALLRSNLLEIDLVIKWTIKRGTVVGILLAAFFVASQLAQAILPGVLGGPIVGGIVVGLLLFAIAPLQRFAERLSDKAMPNAKHVEELGKDERTAIYLDMARMAWKDGTINRTERSMLNELQVKLGLSDAAAKKLEDQAAATG